ncbi:hypothetical protein K7G98_14090 [Saccharothrix sp. MB29]|nr:hypothetical protein [Saccharothrix sp. MB29]
MHRLGDTGRVAPLLFLDVDGPLVSFGGTDHPTFPPDDHVHPLLARCDPAHGPRLAALPCEPVWATRWGADANHILPPRLGLPPLPVVDFPDTDTDTDDPPGTHWKTRVLVARAAGRAFAWVDDEITDADRAWVATHHTGPALLHRVDPRRGLADADFAALGAWLRSVG